MKYLIDTSALTLKSEPARRRIDALRARQDIAITPVTVMELLFTAQNQPGWERGRARLLDMPQRPITTQTWERALEVQGLLAGRGQHRAPSIPDLLVAAVAELTGLTVLHYDKDFPIIAAVTGQPMERVIED